MVRAGDFLLENNLPVRIEFLPLNPHNSLLQECGEEKVNLENASCLIIAFPDVNFEHEAFFK